MLGAGVISPFHETEGGAAAKVGVKLGWGPDLRLTRCSIVEEDLALLPQPLLQLAPFGDQTLRIESQGLRCRRAGTGRQRMLGQECRPAMDIGRRWRQYQALPRRRAGLCPGRVSLAYDNAGSGSHG